jgi:hypothetical protein
MPKTLKVKRNRKEVLFMIIVMIVFFIVFAVAYVDYRFGMDLIDIGIPARIFNPIVMVLALLSMAKMFYHIVAY